MGSERLGEYLKRERELRGISLEEISEGTKISKRLLTYMEMGKWDELPGDVFARGFLKSYAEFIGIAPEEILLRFEEELSSFQEEEGESNVDVSNSRNKRKNLLITLLILVVLAILGYLTYETFLQNKPSLLKEKKKTQSRHLSSNETAPRISKDLSENGESHKE